MKALRKGFFKGHPNISEELVGNYLNPSPATAKGHMKHPKKRIRSTTRSPGRPATSTVAPLQPVAQLAPPVLSLGNEIQPYPGPTHNAKNGPAVRVDDELIANVFCFVWCICRR